MFRKKEYILVRSFELYKIEHMNQIRRKLSSDQSDPNNRAKDDPSQDWVCLKCNNLNFSFRTKCNRCKVQSREDNEQLLYADFYYYSTYITYHQTEPNNHFRLSDRVVPFMEGIQSPSKKAYLSESQLSIRQDDHLPSVSPLVKRYKADKQKMNRKAKNTVFGWKLYETEAWSECEVPALNIKNVCKDLSMTDDEQASQEFAKSVQRMII